MNTISFTDLYKAYTQCRIGKQFNRQQALFEMRLSENLVKLAKELSSKTYKISPHHYFVITKPKPREIFSAHFRDRVVHHYLVSKLTPMWEKKFSDASFACRKRKGTLAAIKEFQKKVHKISQGGTKHVYILQMDIASFFSSIHRKTLVDLLQKHTSDSFLKWLIQACLSHDARIKSKNYTKNGNENLIPKEKSWFSKPAEFGLPIGNLTSQFAANVYLNDFDHFIERKIKPQGYLRYVDDILFIDMDENKLKKLITLVKNFLFETRKMLFNDKKTKLSKITEEISFLGYKIKQEKYVKNTTTMLLPKKKKWEFIRALKSIEKINFCQTSKLHPLMHLFSNKENKELLSGINSRLGFMKHANSFSFRKNAMKKLLNNTALKEFNLENESIAYWRTLSSKKNYSAIRIRKRLVKNN